MALPNGVYYPDLDYGDHPHYSEPELNGIAPPNGLRATKDTICSECKTVVHQANHKAATMLWVGTGKGVYCLKCFYEGTKSIKLDTMEMIDWAFEH